MKFRPYYLWVALPVLIIVAWVALFYWPLAKEERLRRQEAAATAKAIEATDRELADAGRVLDEERQIKQSLSDLYSRIPHLTELPDLMRWMAGRAKREGLVLDVVQSNVSALKGSGNSGVVHPVIEVRVKGRFLDVGRFFDDLEDRTLFRAFTSATIVSEERDNPMVLAKCTLELNAWKERPVEVK